MGVAGVILPPVAPLVPRSRSLSSNWMWPPQIAFAIAASASLSKFETTETEEYTIGDGDEDRRTGNGPARAFRQPRMGPDGKITLPVSESYEIPQPNA